jgi:hypothetical protein
MINQRLRLRSYRVYRVSGSTGDEPHAPKDGVCRADRGKLSRTDRVRAIVTRAKFAVDAVWWAWRELRFLCQRVRFHANASGAVANGATERAKTPTMST